MNRTILFLAFLIISVHLFAQGYKEFWFVAPEVYQAHGDRPIWMRISTTTDTAQIELSQPASPSFTPIVGVINPNSTLSINLTTWIDSIEDKPADVVHNYGLKINSNTAVDAYYEEASADNPEIFTLKGKNALGTEFYIDGQGNYPNHWTANYTAEAFDIVATQDGTIVTITVSNDIVGHAKGSTFAVQLNKGQTYSARSTSNVDTITLAGSHITSNYPIAITISDDSIQEPDLNPAGWDLIGDQIVPVTLLGKEYIAIKGFGNDNDERVYMEAISDSTKIYLDGSVTPVTTINQAQLYCSHFTNLTLLIKSSNPIYAYHLSGLPNEAGSAILPQDSCTGSRQVGFYRTDAGTFALLVLTRSGNQGNFTIDGDATLLTSSDFSPVTGTSNAWYYARKTYTSTQLPVGSHNILNSSGKFHVGILNGDPGSAEYGFYSDFSSLYLGPDAFFCQGDSVVLDGGAYMTSYLWQEKVGGVWIQVDTTRYYTVHDSGYYACTEMGDFCVLSDTIHFSLYPKPTVSLGPDRTICEGHTTTFDPGSFVSYLWNTGYTGRLITTGTPGEYWVAVTNSSGCVARDTINLFVDSIPRTNHAITGPASICNGQNNVLYSISVLPFATSYVWNLPAGVSGSSTTDSIYLSFSSSLISAMIKVHGHDSCGSGPDTSFNITIKPEPHLINSPAYKTICNDSSTNITLTSDVSGTLFTWTVTDSSGYISGFTSNLSNSTTLLNQTLVNLSNTIESIVYHLTPIANGCDGPVTDFRVYINPTPTLSNNPLSKQQCNDMGTNITLTTSVPGSLFTWSSTGSSPDITGFTNNTAPSFLINDILHNSGSSVETVTYHITPVINGCLGTVYNYIITVYPTPVLSNSPSSKQQCNNLYTNVILTSNVMGTLFTWTATGSSLQITGFENDTIPSITLNDLLVNTGYNTETVIYHITPSANGCNGSVINLIVTVYPTPDVYFNPSSQVICPLQTTSITNLSHVSGTTFFWIATGSSPLVSGFSNGTGGSINQTLNNTATEIEQVTYQVTPVANSCTGTIASVIVTINPASLTTFTSCFDTITTLSAKPIILKGGVPLDGIYSGSGVNSVTGIFTPSAAGTGIKTITYSYTNVYSCSTSATRHIIVYSAAMFSCGNALTDIRDNNVYPTVKIGTQCWLASNLNYGTIIASSQDQRDNCLAEKYCYNDNATNCATLGGLYQWDELMLYDSTPADQGFCPPDWHIPTENEWNTLFVSYTNSGFAGAPLKYSGYSGFNALLTGTNYFHKSWDFKSFATFFWSSTAYSRTEAWAHGMNDNDPSVSFYPSSRANAFSVRCIHD
jgi:uncharacterized protein (TIGR02145 family)